MTPPPDPEPGSPQPDSDASDGTDKSADDWILEFIGLQEDEPPRSLHEFLASVPEDLRRAVRRGCRRFLDVQVQLEAERACALRPEDESQAPDVPGYRILESVDEGGMGRVWRGERIADGFRVAIKVLNANLADSIDARERFQREIDVGRKLDHPGLVKVLDQGQVADRPYLVLPFVAGGSLAQRLEAHVPSEGPPFPSSRLARIAIGVLDALVYCHERGVYHRDIKPSNILLGLNDEARLIDFGLAGLTERPALTQIGTLVGTLRYMSPEQTLMARTPVDHRSDIYSLGTVMYEMLTGEPPFRERGDGGNLLQDILFADPRPPSHTFPQIHRDLETICLKALEKSPAHRYQSAADMREDLKRFLRHEAIHARPARRIIRLTRRVARHRAALGLLAGVVLALGAAGAWFLLRDLRPTIAVLCQPGLAVHVRRLDPAIGGYGDARYLGQTPLHEEPLDPGRYRINLIKSEDEFAELSRWIGPDDLRIVGLVPLRSTAKVVARMVRFHPDGAFVIGKKAAWNPVYREKTRPALPAFAMDRTEVSVGEFKAYLHASGVPAPMAWRDGIFPDLADYPDDKPAVSLRLVEVLGYLEWVGKRLPTRSEWERVARGKTGRRTLVDAEPWSDHGIRAFRPTVRRLYTKRTRFEDFVRFCLPPDFANADRTPEGILHLMGNVGELVDAFYCAAPGQPERSKALFKGGNWFDSPTFAALDGFGTCDATLPVGAFRVGFRGAKSLFPLPRSGSQPK